MDRLLPNPMKAALLGLALAALVLVGWMASTRVDAVGLISVLLRYLHVLAGLVWVGAIAFTNFIHIPAVEAASDADRAAFVRGYVPKLMASISHLSHATLLSGILLMVAAGYVMSEALFGSAVFVPSARSALLGLGAAGGIVMWAIVQFAMRPRLALVADPTVSAGDKAALRPVIRGWARINLVLMLPVTMAMLLAAHGA